MIYYSTSVKKNQQPKPTTNPKASKWWLFQCIHLPVFKESSSLHSCPGTECFMIMLRGRLRSALEVALMNPKVDSKPSFCKSSNLLLPRKLPFPGSQLRSCLLDGWTTVNRKCYNSVCYMSSSCISCETPFIFFSSVGQPHFSVSLWAFWSSRCLCHWFWKNIIQNFYLGWAFSMKLLMRKWVSGSHLRNLCTFVSFHL